MSGFPKFRGAITALFLFAAFGLPASAQLSGQLTFGGTSGGSANAQTCAVPNFPTTPPVGVEFTCIAGFSNTGTTQLNIGGSGLINVFKPSTGGAVALAGGEILAGQVFSVKYDGTQYQLTSNSAQSAAVRFAPQGYLTPCPASSPPTGCTAGQLLPTGDVTVGVGQTVTGFVYTPAVGNQIPIYNGSNLIVTTFPELTITPSSSHVANTLYDVCVFNNSGTPTGVIGPAWTSSAAGGGNRGTGAGTAQITRVQGIWVNAVQISGVNGASTFTIPANQCTYVGSIFMDGSNGVVSWLMTAGQSRKVGFWNAYNRLPLRIKVVDATASWTYGNTTTWQQARATAGNLATVLVGLPQESVSATYAVNTTTAGNVNGVALSGIGWNSTSALSGVQGQAATNTSNGNGGGNAIAHYDSLPFIGIANVAPIEKSGAATNTYFGTNPFMQMTVGWNG